MRRNFNKGEKQLLYTIAGGKCCICFTKLPSNWHADHIIPYSKGGKTSISNGQALCPKCNQTKSNHMFKLREWQRDFLKEYSNHEKNTYLLHAGVGSGKTFAAVQAAKPYLDQGWKVIVISPTENIKSNWATEFKKIGYELDKKYSFKYDFQSQYDGVSITFHGLNGFNSVHQCTNGSWLVRNNIVTNKTFIIIDEVHHAALSSSWGESILDVGIYAGKVLMLTGTPFRDDNQKIPFCLYNPKKDGSQYELETNYSYGYEESVKDEYCCPISFKIVDVVHKDENLGRIEADIEGRKKINAALTINGNQFVMSMVQMADGKLNDLCIVRPVKGLIICKSIQDAMNLHEKMPDAEIVTSDDPLSSKKIESFKTNNRRWIISVNQVAEGVDIPSIRVIVYATNITTMLYFTQASGRGVRNRDDLLIGDTDHCHVYIPNYEPLVENADRIENSIKHIVKAQKENLKERLERRASENDPTENGYMNDDFFGELGDVMNKGVEINNNEQNWIKSESTANDIPPMLLERVYAKAVERAERSHAPMKSDRVAQIKKDINKKVNRIFYLLNQNTPQKEIHKDLNKRVGIEYQPTEHDEQKLNSKLNLAEQWTQKIMD